MSATPSDLGAVGLPDSALGKALGDLVRSPGAAVVAFPAVHHFGELGGGVSLQSLVQDRADLRFDVGATEGAQEIVDGKKGSTEFFHGSGHRDILLILMLNFLRQKENS